jgi:hypothetical protein
MGTATSPPSPPPWRPSGLAFGERGCGTKGKAISPPRPWSPSCRRKRPPPAVWAAVGVDGDVTPAVVPLYRSKQRPQTAGPLFLIHVKVPTTRATENLARAWRAGWGLSLVEAGPDGIKATNVWLLRTPLAAAIARSMLCPTPPGDRIADSARRTLIGRQRPLT